MDSAQISNGMMDLDNSETKTPNAPISVNPSGPPSQFKKDESNNFITLVATIFGSLFLFFIFLAVLNYFGLISLKSFSPQVFGLLPTRENVKGPQVDNPYPDSAFFDSKNNVWTISGILHSYNGNIIEIESEDKIIKLEFVASESMFYTQGSLLNEKGGQVVLFPDTFSELEKNENLGKRVEVIYKPGSNEQKIIQSITLQNQP